MGFAFSKGILAALWRRETTRVSASPKRNRSGYGALPWGRGQGRSFKMLAIHRAIAVSPQEGVRARGGQGSWET